jgi:hypothetical protein
MLRHGRDVYVEDSNKQTKWRNKMKKFRLEQSNLYRDQDDYLKPTMAVYQGAHIDKVVFLKAVNLLMNYLEIEIPELSAKDVEYHYSRTSYDEEPPFDGVIVWNKEPKEGYELTTYLDIGEDCERLEEVVFPADLRKTAENGKTSPGEEKQP